MLQVLYIMSGAVIPGGQILQTHTFYEQHFCACLQVTICLFNYSFSLLNPNWFMSPSLADISAQTLTCYLVRFPGFHPFIDETINGQILRSADVCSFEAVGVLEFIVFWDHACCAGIQNFSSLFYKLFLIKPKQCFELVTILSKSGYHSLRKKSIRFTNRGIFELAVF